MEAFPSCEAVVLPALRRPTNAKYSVSPRAKLKIAVASGVARREGEFIPWTDRHRRKVRNDEANFSVASRPELINHSAPLNFIHM